MELVYTFFTPNKKGLHACAYFLLHARAKPLIVSYAQLSCAYCLRSLWETMVILLFTNYKNAVLLCAASTTAC